MVSPSAPHASARARRVALPVVLWVFGLATSVMLVGIWGRTVAVDEPTVKDAARVIVDDELAAQRIRSWLETALSDVVGSDEEAAELVDEIASQPAFPLAVESIVEDFVAALFAPPGEEQEIRIAETLAPMIPLVTSELASRDIDVPPQQIEEALDAAPVIELDNGEAAAVTTAVEQARTILTRVVALAAAILLVSGVTALALAERRYLMLRHLGVRVLISAATFAVLFRVGAWALDPKRGRSPLLGGGAVLLGSNGQVFLIASVLAAAVAAVGGVVAWRRSRANSVATQRSAEHANI